MRTFEEFQAYLDQLREKKASLTQQLQEVEDKIDQFLNTPLVPGPQPPSPPPPTPPEPPQEPPPEPEPEQTEPEEQESAPTPPSEFGELFSHVTTDTGEEVIEVNRAPAPPLNREQTDDDSEETTEFLTDREVRNALNNLPKYVVMSENPKTRKLKQGSSQYKIWETLDNHGGWLSINQLNNIVNMNVRSLSSQASAMVRDEFLEVLGKRGKFRYKAVSNEAVKRHSVPKPGNVETVLRVLQKIPKGESFVIDDVMRLINKLPEEKHVGESVAARTLWILFRRDRAVKRSYRKWALM